MKILIKRIFALLFVAAYIVLLPVLAFAHSGRTDSSGGHRDNKNKSGLGSYHYHCGGYPAHLHPNGVCPYSSGGSSRSYSGGSSSSTPRSSISVKNMPSKMNVGDEVDLSYSLGLSYDYVDWSSNNTDVLTVSSSGILTAVAPGTAKVTAEMSEGSKTFTITIVSVPVKKITASIENPKIEVGDSYSIDCEITPSNATYKDLVFSSSDKNVATVDSYGQVTAVGEGAATITVKAPKDSANAKVEISVFAIYPESISINTDELKLEMTTTDNLEATIYPENATFQDVDWESSDESVVSIDSYGVCTPISLGSATITATTQNGKSTEIPVTVFEIPDKEVTLSVSEEPDLNILGIKMYDKSRTVTIVSEISPEDATYTDVVFDTSEGYISSNGELSCSDGGTCKVTATSHSNQTAEITVHFVDTDSVKSGVGVSSVALLGTGGFFGYKSYKKKKNISE